MYGTIDASVANHNTGIVSHTTLENSVFATSNLGLRGSEDLGGGLKAFFDLQGDLFPDVGGVGAAGAAQTGLATTIPGSNLFNRSSLIGLSGAFGTAQFGRFGDSTDSWHNAASGGFNLFNALQGSAAGGKNANTIGYMSPEVVPGLTVRFERSLGSATEGVTAATKNDAVHNSAGVQYVRGPLTLRYATASENRAASAGATPNDSKDRNTVLGASYNFGIAAVSAVMMTDKRVTKATNVVANEDTSVNIGVTVPQGAFTYIFNYQSIDERTAATANDDTKSLGLGVRYALSKRTAANVAYRKVTNTNAAALGGAAAGGDPKTVAIGVSHSF